MVMVKTLKIYKQQPINQELKQNQNQNSEVPCIGFVMVHPDGTHIYPHKE